MYRVPVCHILHFKQAGLLSSSGDDDEGEGKDGLSGVQSVDEPGSSVVSKSVVTADRTDNKVTTDNDVSDEEVEVIRDVHATRAEVANPLDERVIVENVDNNRVDVDNVEINPRVGQGIGVDDGWVNCDTLPQVRSAVLFKSKDSGELSRATVLSKGGKSGGKNEKYMNIHVDGEENPKGVFWDQHVDVWKPVEFEEHVVYFVGSDLYKQKVLDAKQAELQNWIKNEVFVKVVDTGQKCVSSRWVITEKCIDGSEETKIKTRIVCRGFEEDSSRLRTDSPTCTKESLRIVLTFIAAYGWVCKSLDVRAAFLQGFPIERDVFLKPPSDIEEKGYLWKLLKCPYGLNDAPRTWYRRISSELLKLGISCSKFDEALFYCLVDNILIGLLVVHVDDVLYGGNSRFQGLILKFASIIEVGACNSGCFKYLGLDVFQNKSEICVDQDRYIQGLEGIKVSRSRAMNTKSTATEDERKEVKRVCGQLLWVTNNTRPDFSFEVSMLCNVGKTCTVGDLLRVNKLIDVLKRDKLVIKFPKLGDPDSWTLCAFCDSSFANLADGSSQAGYILFIKAKNGKVSPIGWQSRKLQRVTKSTLSSETLAVIEAVDAARLVKVILQEICCLSPKIEIYTDSKSLYQTVSTSKVLTDKSQRINIGYLRQFVKTEEILIKWVQGSDQVADVLTKRGGLAHGLKDLLEAGQL